VPLWYAHRPPGHFGRPAITTNEPMSYNRALTELVQQESKFIDDILSEVGKVIVGQPTMVERLLIGLLARGHVLLEGVPGLAKTLTVRTLCDVIQAQFARVQFTPDLLPADLIGTVIYRPQDGSFVAKKGPIFANLVLADEINRAPAKVQSALLEAMQEGQVTIGDQTFKLPEPFIVMATQNPIEQEGTYPLPEAQVDRFMLMVKVNYPTREEERAIMDRQTAITSATVTPKVTPEQLLKARVGDPRDLRRRQAQGLHRLDRVRDPRAREGAGPQGALAAHSRGRLAPRHHRAEHGRARPGVLAAPRVRDP
jgi:MoxR-like ATPase